MNILGIETSCDETAAAVVKDGRHILSNIVASQIDIHAQFGGVVPEIAARSHIEAMLPVVEKAFEQAFPQLSSLTGSHSAPDRGSSDLDPRLRRNDNTLWDQIDGIAVTAGPGLLGSLLIGTLTARTLAELHHKPLYAINHVEAHVYANFLDSSHIKGQMLNVKSEWQPPDFPLLAMIVSGGHSQIVLFHGHHNYQVLGQTRDDAAGEAFDKIAKLLGLGFPGGPALEKAALNGDPNAFTFPKAKLGKDSLDYSFSGVKTAVLRQVQTMLGLDQTAASHTLAPLLNDQQKNDVAASFQKTVIDTLVDRMMVAYERHSPKSVVIAGGVAASQALRTELKKRLPIEINYAAMNLCTDNAAMIAALGYWYAHDGMTTDPKLLVADSSMQMHSHSIRD